MSKLYSPDLRTRVAAFAIVHKSTQLATTTFSVSRANAVRWAKQLRDTGSVAIGRVGSHKKPILLDRVEWIAKWMASESHVTLRTLQSELEASEIKVSYGALWNFISLALPLCGLVMPRISSASGSRLGGFAFECNG